MDTDATDDQRALLEVSTRFMEDTCPLRAVRDGAWRDDAFATSYRRQAAELGWFSMLVPESLGGGSVSGNGVLDAALIAYPRGGRLQPGSFVGTNVVAYAVAHAGSAELRDDGAPGAAGRRGARRRGRWPSGGGRLDGGVDGASDRRRRPRAVRREDGGAGRRRRVVAARHVRGDRTVRPRSLIAADAPGVTVTELDSLDLSRRFAEVRFDGARVAASAVVGAPGRVEAQLLARQLAVACHAHRRRVGRARWTTTSR